MTVPRVAAALVVAYLLGSVPVGLWIVRARTGKDVRQLHSGRTGGTNVARAAGVWAGLATGLGDLIKSGGAVVLARALGAGNAWLEAAAGALAVLGHNYSVFLLQRANGRYVFRGGAGGAPTIGAAIAMWPSIGLVMLPITMGLLVGVGYASLATLSTGLLATVVFLLRARAGEGPWAYVAFGLLAEGLLLWALRPNLRRLAAGTERIIGWRARWRARRDSASRGDKIGEGDDGGPAI
jgi:glycerol-3-phosphate acyltransferase PlsY